MKLRTRIERIRDSQFVVPVVFIVLSIILVVVTTQLDEHVSPPDLLIPAKIGGVRTLLATVAGSIITAAALVFSFSAITVQLASSQYSPRLVQEFLRDRVQQSIAGLVMGTFTFALTSLATLGVNTSDEARTDWTATTAVVLGVASAVSIVVFIDHITRRIRIDDTIRRITMRTVATFEAAGGGAAVAADGWNLQPETRSSCVRSAETGFIQEIECDRLVEALQPGIVARLDVWTGGFVAEGGRLLTVWTERAAPAPAALREFIAVGDTRTIERDPEHGIRQLVDIGLRALSPGVNDPATAADVARNLALCVRAAYLVGPPTRVWVSGNGARLFAPHARGPSDHVAVAYEPIRRKAADEPMVLGAIVESLESLADELEEREIDATAIDREVAAASATLRELGEPVAGSQPQ